VAVAGDRLYAAFRAGDLVENLHPLGLDLVEGAAVGDVDQAVVLQHGGRSGMT
jgi:hypothetical protein